MTEKRFSVSVVQIAKEVYEWTLTDNETGDTRQGQSDSIDNARLSASNVADDVRIQQAPILIEEYDLD